MSMYRGVDVWIHVFLTSAWKNERKEERNNKFWEELIRYFPFTTYCRRIKSGHLRGERGSVFAATAP
jgi:hypothetical protein